MQLQCQYVGMTVVVHACVHCSKAQTTDNTQSIAQPYVIPVAGGGEGGRQRYVEASIQTTADVRMFCGSASAVQPQLQLVFPCLSQIPSPRRNVVTPQDAERQRDSTLERW
jgi:hypothetical protein